MNKKIVLCAMLLMCTLLFSACQSNSNPYTPLNDGQNVFGGTQQTQQQPQQQQGSAGMLSGLGQGAKLPEEPDAKPTTVCGNSSAKSAATSSPKERNSSTSATLKSKKQLPGRMN